MELMFRQGRVVVRIECPVSGMTCKDYLLHNATSSIYTARLLETIDGHMICAMRQSHQFASMPASAFLIGFGDRLIATFATVRVVIAEAVTAIAHEYGTTLALWGSLTLVQRHLCKMCKYKV